MAKSGLTWILCHIEEYPLSHWADVNRKDQICNCCDGFVMHPISALTLAAPVCEWRLVEVPLPKMQCAAVPIHDDDTARSSMAQGDHDAAKS